MVARLPCKQKVVSSSLTASTISRGKKMIRDILDVSLTDFPEHVASVLFYERCNMRCPYCHNPELVNVPQTRTIYHPELLKNVPQPYPIKTIIDRLEANQLIDGVVLTGGEPLLSAILPYDVATMKWLDLDIKLDTNGTAPNLLQNMFPLLDYIAMDVKTAERMYRFLGWDDTEAIRQSIRIIMKSGIDYEFRCTAVEPFLTEETAWEIGEMVEGAKRFYIQKPRLNGKILDPTYPMGPTENLKCIEDVLNSYVAEVFIR